MTSRHKTIDILSNCLIVSALLAASVNAYIDTQFNTEMRLKMDTELPKLMDTITRVEERQLMIIKQMK